MKIIDILIVSSYMLLLLFIGFRLKNENKNQKDYFIGGRSLPALPVAFSIAATTISANGFIGGPGWAYDIGLKAFMLNISIPLVLAVTLTIFLPIYYNLKVISIYEYIEKRLGVGSRILAVLSYMVSQIIQVGSMIYIPSLFINKITGWSLNIIVPIILLITIFYTLLGGIKAVIWTDFFQMLIMWVAVITVFVIAYSSCNSDFLGIFNLAKSAGKFNTLDFSTDFSVSNGVWASVLGGSVMWLKYYACDQTQTQRMFTAKSIKDIKKSILQSAFVMNILYFFFMILGIIIFVALDGKKFSNSNDVMISFIINEIPTGFKGLIVAGIFASAMSSIDSILNSVSAVFIKDVYEKFIAKGKDASLALSMIFTAFFGVVVVIFTLFAYNGVTSSILAVVGKYISFFSGSILAMFVLALFTRRANDAGVSIGFISGIILTILISKIYTINWLWNYLIGFILSSVLGYIISILTDKRGNKDNFDYTLYGIKMRLCSNGEITENGVSLVPAKMDLYTYILLAFFILQFVFFGLLQR